MLALNGHNVKLRDTDWGHGEVSLWHLDSPVGRTLVPEGTLATVVGHSMNGYLLVQVGSDVFEVWHENAGAMALN